MFHSFQRETHFPTRDNGNDSHSSSTSRGRVMRANPIGRSCRQSRLSRRWTIRLNARQNIRTSGRVFVRMRVTNFWHRPPPPPPPLPLHPPAERNGVPFPLFLSFSRDFQTDRSSFLLCLLGRVERCIVARKKLTSGVKHASDNCFAANRMAAGHGENAWITLLQSSCNCHYSRRKANRLSLSPRRKN